MPLVNSGACSQSGLREPVHRFMKDYDQLLNSQPDEEKKPVSQAPVSNAQEVLEPSEDIPVSPPWSPTTKLLVGIALVLACAYLLTRFLNIVGPLLLALLLAYLFHPVAEWLQKVTHVSWRAATTIVYIVLVLLILSSLGLSGLALVEQVQSLINFLQGALKDLPGTLSNLASQSFEFGPFQFNFQLVDVNVITQQILGAVEPILTQAGTSVVSVATKVGTAVGGIFFMLLVSYFVLAESGGSSNQLVRFSIPGYEEDITQLSQALGNIWNSFLRGQLTIVLITIVVYNIILGGLRVHYFFGLAVLAGMARFVPYVGPFVAWTTYGLVAFFQGSTVFGLSPIGYVALVVGCAWVTDLVMDNVVVPRLMGNALRVHPAAVMVSALVALNLLGVIGVVLAAPVLATVQLILEYVLAKLLDQNPWVRIGKEIGPASPPQPIWQSIKIFIARLNEKLNKILSKGSDLRKVFLRR